MRRAGIGTTRTLYGNSDKWIMYTWIDSTTYNISYHCKKESVQLSEGGTAGMNISFMILM